MAAFIMRKIKWRYQKNGNSRTEHKKVMEENEVLKQLIELFNQQDMSGQSQDFMGIFWYVAGMQMQLSAMVIIPYDSYHESQITIPTIRGNRTSNTLFSSTCKVADAQ